MAQRWVRWQLVQLSGNQELLKKRRLRAKRERVAISAAEETLERRWFNAYLDRCVRGRLRLFLTRDEIDAISLAFDRFASVEQDDGSKLMTKIDFVSLFLLGIGQCASNQHDETTKRPRKACDPEQLKVDDILALFSHAQAFLRPNTIIPGRDHPYIALRRKKKNVVQRTAEAAASKAVHAVRRGPRQELLEQELALALADELSEQLDEEATRTREHTSAADTLQLHEFLLAASFWRRQSAFYQDEPCDDVSFFFSLFDGANQKRWTEGEFAEAMRTLLEGVYISDYEGSVEIPVDCDPSDKIREELESAQFEDINDVDRKDAQRLAEVARKNIIERYLDVVFADMDKAQVGVLEVEDLVEWLQENPEAKAEFQHSQAEDGTLHSVENAVLQAFRSVGAVDGGLNREQFYALIESTHILSHTLSEQLEIKLFDLSRTVAQDELGLQRSGHITLSKFRKYLRTAPDKRIASMVVRVGRAVRTRAQSIGAETARAMCALIEFQANKPRFRPVQDGLDPELVQFKRKMSPSLLELRKKFTQRSALDQIRLTPLADELGHAQWLAPFMEDAPRRKAQLQRGATLRGLLRSISRRVMDRPTESARDNATLSTS